jgi:hypothetical protein
MSCKNAEIPDRKENRIRDRERRARKNAELECLSLLKYKAGNLRSKKYEIERLLDYFFPIIARTVFTEAFSPI